MPMGRMVRVYLRAVMGSSLRESSIWVKRARSWVAQALKTMCHVVRRIAGTSEQDDKDVGEKNGGVLRTVAEA